MLQLACLWNLQHRPVSTVIPTLIQEAGKDAKAIEEKLDELASLPDLTLASEEMEEIARVGDNRNCMSLKGGSAEHGGDATADRWSLNPELEAVAARWHIDPQRDLSYSMPPVAGSP
jgi:hypothetical protein